MIVRPARLATIPAVLSVALWGCGEVQPTGSPILVDPTTTQHEVGGTDDVFQVCQKMVDSMRRDPDVHVKPAPRYVILEAENITVDPKLAGYNARMLYNDFTARLNRAAGTEFRFIDRKAVSAERQRQLTGEVKTSGVEKATAGADMVLSIELIALQGAASKTVQYNFKLTDLEGVDLWTDNDTIVKRS